MKLEGWAGATSQQAVYVLLRGLHLICSGELLGGFKQEMEIGILMSIYYTIL